MDTNSAFALPFLTIYLVGMTVTWCIEWYATGRQMNLLKDKKKAEEKFTTLDEDIKAIYNFEKILEGMKY